MNRATAGIGSSMTSRMKPNLVVLLAVLLPLTVRDVQAARYIPPLDTALPMQPLQLAQAELAAGNADAAARRIVSLEQDDRPVLLSSDWGMISLPVWLSTLPDSQRQALALALDRLQSPPAQRALASLNKDEPSIEALLMLAERFPLTSVARQATLEAARRLATLGDVVSALDLFDRAARSGGSLVPEDAALVEQLRAARATQASKIGFAGISPFEATWFAQRQPYESLRVWPLVSGSSVILVGPTQVIGGTTRGLVAWTWSVETLLQDLTGKPPDKSRLQQLASRHPTLGYEPALLSDLDGKSRIVVVRQPSVRNPGYLALRAISATDGRLLWATDLGERFDSLSFVSSPAVVGRYCYAAARKRQRDTPEQLVLLALETTTGSPLWETALGELSDRVDARLERDRDALAERNDLFADLTAPGVDADHVYLNPGGQSLLAVDRFTGRLRWLHRYDDSPTEPPRNDRLKSARREALQRFRTTTVPTAHAVLLAPRDALPLLAVSRRDGRGLWTCAVSPSGTLVGAADGIAVLVSVDALHGVRVGDGTVAWTNPLSGARRPTGPGVLQEGAYWAPLPRGLIGFSLETGESTATPSRRVPAFHGLLSAAPLRAAMIRAGIVEAFLVSRDNRPERGN